MTVLGVMCRKTDGEMPIGVMGFKNRRGYGNVGGRGAANYRQDGAKMGQDGAKMGHDGAKLSEDAALSGTFGKEGRPIWAKTAAKLSQDPVLTDRNGSKVAARSLFLL